MEQPEGFIQRGLRAVLGGLRMAGYKFDPPLLLSATQLGAMHKRKRLFIVSYSDTVVVDGKLAECCSNQQPVSREVMMAVGIGQ